SRLFEPIFQAIVDAEVLATHCRTLADDRFKAQSAKVAARRDEQMLEAKYKQTRTIAAAESHRDDRLREINETYARKKVEIQTKQQVDLRGAIEAYERRKAELRTLAEANTNKLEEK